MRTAWKSWWPSEGGGKQILALALPLVVSTSSWTIMQFIDRLFLFYYEDGVALAASFPAAIMNFLSCCVFLGTAQYVNTFVSQYYGAKRFERIGVAVWQGMWIAALSAPLLLATIPLAPAFFAWVDHAPDVQAQEAIYYQICTLGSPIVVAGAALAAFFTGRGDMRTVMLIDLAAAVVNIVFDYLWIFGRLGFPEMGIAGAAWATILAQYFKAAVCLAIMLRASYREQFGTWRGCYWDNGIFRRLVRFGIPSGVQWLLEAGGFAGLLNLVGQLGTRELMVSNLVFNIGNVAFLPMFGFSIAATTWVGQKLGEDRPQMAARGVWSAFGLASIYIVTVGSIYLFVPDLFLQMHAGGDAKDFTQTRALAIVLLRFVSAYCFFDMMNLVFVGALKGAGDTRFIMLNSLVMSTIPFGIAWYGINYLDYGLMAMWTIITIWICIVGLTYMARFMQGRWKTMRVIEPDLVEEDARVEEAELAIEAAELQSQGERGA